MTNDDLLHQPGRRGRRCSPATTSPATSALAFYATAPGPAGTSTSASSWACACPTPTRGIATADTRGDGALDFAVARQWGPPAFYANTATAPRPLPRPGAVPAGDRRRSRPGPGRRSARPPTGDGRGSPPRRHTQISQLDGGGGHGGKRSFEVYFGLGSYDGPVTVHLHWRDTDGQLHQQTLQLSPGTHDLMLTSTATGGSEPMTTTVKPVGRHTGASRRQPARRGQGKTSTDPRYLALRNFAMSISVFNIFGYTLLGFEQPWLWPIFAVLDRLHRPRSPSSVISAWAQRRAPGSAATAPAGMYEFLLPAHITAPGRATCCSTPTTSSGRSCSRVVVGGRPEARPAGARSPAGCGTS